MKTEEWYMLTKAYDKASEALDELQEVITLLSKGEEDNISVKLAGAFLESSISLMEKAEKEASK